MRLIRKLLQWLMIGFTAALLLPSLAIQQYLPTIFLIAAILVILPFTKPFIAKKLPIFGSTIVRCLLWFSFVFIAFLTSVSEAESTSSRDPSAPPRLSAAQKAEIFTGKISSYTSIPNLKDSSSNAVNIDGKVLVVNKSMNETTPSLMALVPAEVRPNTPDDVKYVVWLETESKLIGTYSDGSKGFQVTCNVTLIDKASSSILAKNSFTGPIPPATKRRSSGDQTGGMPEAEIKRYLADLID
jgi:hypothetical protein